MSHWYDKYLSVYGKPLSEVSQNIVGEIRERLSALQSTEPLVSVVVIAYNEECRLAACLWSLSKLKTKYPIEIIGVNNNSKDHTEEVYKLLGVPYYNETRQSPGYARQCGLNHSKGKYHFFIDADTFYPSCYVDLMMNKLRGWMAGVLTATIAFVMVPALGNETVRAGAFQEEKAEEVQSIIGAWSAAYLPSLL